FSAGVYILIAVGGVMMFVGFLGCYGAIQESQCLLGTFFACLVILFACEVAAGIWGFINKDQIAKGVKDFYDDAYSKAITVNVMESEDTKNKAKQVLKSFHDAMKCCGGSKFTGVLTNLGTDLCPKKSNLLQLATEESCHERIDELFSKKLSLIGIAALVVAVIMIFEMVLSMVLCCSIRSSSVY
uniref:Tetraspanin n=1 Tax=Latimeria chalumnae TaxID=7897 RepID=H3A0G2_LATCH